MGKHIPLRKCMACNLRKEKNDLIRIVKDELKVTIDLTYKAPGRGAYICKSKDCIEKVIKTKRLEKEFNSTIDENVYNDLKELERSL